MLYWGVALSQVAVPEKGCPEVGTLMVPIEYYLIETFFLTLFGEEEVSVNLRKILGHCVKRSGLGILVS